MALTHQNLIAHNPFDQQAHRTLGYYFLGKNNTAQAWYHFSKIPEDSTEIFRSHALSLKEKELYDDAHEWYRYLANQDKTWSNLFHYGCFAISIGNIDEGINAMREASALQPSMATQHNSAYAHKIKGEFDKALPLLHGILAVDPHNEGAHLTLANSYLNKGDFINGHKYNDWNLKKQNKDVTQLRSLIKNNQLTGKKIWLRCEGGLGDSIQYIRYAQRLKKMGAHIIAFVQQPLVKLFSNCPYIDQLITLGNSIPEHDITASFMALPNAFNDTPQMVTTHIPYLFPDEILVEKWRPLFDNDKINIGICWCASKENDRSRLPIARRNIPLQLLQQIATIEKVQLFSLQQQDGIEELDNISFNLYAFDENFDKENGAFMDTAAVMTHLDLIISVDTAVAHLAGALGTPVWLLLPYCTDTRWIFGRTDSPWYPTMRIFKQPKPFGWNSVIDTLASKLKTIICKITKPTH